MTASTLFLGVTHLCLGASACVFCLGLTASVYVLFKGLPLCPLLSRFSSHSFSHIHSLLSFTLTLTHPLFLYELSLSLTSSSLSFSRANSLSSDLRGSHTGEGRGFRSSQTTKGPGDPLTPGQAPAFLSFTDARTLSVAPGLGTEGRRLEQKVQRLCSDSQQGMRRVWKTSGFLSGGHPCGTTIPETGGLCSAPPRPPIKKTRC